MVSARTLFDEGRKILETAGIENPLFECGLLLQKHFGVSKYDLIVNDVLITEQKKDEFLKDTKKRAEFYPLQYILGVWEFMSLEFIVTPDVLVPRADTETVTNAAIKLFEDKGSIVFADLCTGCGCIATALAIYLKNSRGYALDISQKACGIAEQNTQKNGVADRIKVINHDIFAGFSIINGELDLIISNPPYVKSQEINTLSKEVRYEPQTALNGGEDGLLFYRHIIPSALPLLKQNGYLCLEVGYDQYGDVAEILKDCGFRDINAHMDLNNIQRAVTARKA